MSDSPPPPGAPPPGPPPPPPSGDAPAPPRRALPSSGSRGEGIEDHRFPCDTCGADMRYSPTEGELICDFCGNREPIRSRAAGLAQLREIPIADAARDAIAAADMEETRIIACHNCGARVEFEPGIHAMECPFCATPLVADTGISRHIKPRGLLPFSLSESEARAAMTDWLGSLWLAPGGLRDYARKGRRLSGVYMPYWTFDAATRTRYRGQRGTVYYITETVLRDGRPVQVQRQRIRWSPVAGRVARAFDDILILASRSLPRRFTEGLEPWDLSLLEPYAPEYLAGFRAEAYGLEVHEGLEEAREVMDRVIERDVKFDIGGDRQLIDALETDISDITFKHILLPVWIAAYKYRGKSYRFVVNGRSGRVQGERPYSPVKVALAVLAGLILAAAAGWIAAYTR